MAFTIKTREIQYTAADGTSLVGYFAAPESQHPVAGVIVAPEVRSGQPGCRPTRADSALRPA